MDNTSFRTIREYEFDTDMFDSLDVKRVVDKRLDEALNDNDTELRIRIGKAGSAWHGKNKRRLVIVVEKPE